MGSVGNRFRYTKYEYSVQHISMYGLNPWYVGEVGQRVGSEEKTQKVLRINTRNKGPKISVKHVMNVRFQQVARAKYNKAGIGFAGQFSSDTKKCHWGGAKQRLPNKTNIVEIAPSPCSIPSPSRTLPVRAKFVAEGR